MDNTRRLRQQYTELRPPTPAARYPRLSTALTARRQPASFVRWSLSEAAVSEHSLLSRKWVAYLRYSFS
ncbi:hypothetical protein RR46_06873 [Papilio xuthus]|uniref:Uncharacterized protein n=1 Tax=Papilio xuthus TaxID=66420 RepID=A0A194PTQ7_PAPXU|nr:hypothetical protein RR46_06873 [Papilio xuthus]